jgi:glycosyltransferase involved in cell wall biosynthesis
LYVGDVNWNKNVIGLLQAFASIQKLNEFIEMKLVLVGNAFHEERLPETREINQFIHEKGLENSIIRPGKVSLNELACIYSLASVYVQPSYYEGFGLPVLEAMVCGCPVVC